MMKLDAGAFVRACAVLERIDATVEAAKFHDANILIVVIDDEMRRVTGTSLTSLLEHVDILGATNTQKAVRRLQESIDDRKFTYGGLGTASTDIKWRLIDELGSVVLYCLSKEFAGLYDASEPFGADVAAKFPSMSEDIAEAGKCLALDRSTAAVFHLMRVMELALQSLGGQLGVALVTDKNWQNILDEANKAIKALDHRLPRTKALAETASHLYAVKLAWRNEVMHPKQTYTLEQADEIYRNVRTFVRDLAGLI